MTHILSRKRTMARVAAVQALYRYHLTGQNLEKIIHDFCDGKIPLSEEKDYKLRDPDLFSELVEGAITEIESLDAHILSVLVEGWTLDRMGYLLRDILRAAVYEIAHKFETPARVIVNEYVDVTALFFDGSEPKLVNAMLDKLGRSLRVEEFKS